jgi:hypothetical protein
MEDGGASVRGVQLGAGHRVDYSLHTDAGWRTMRFDARCVGADGSVRHLEVVPSDLGEDVLDVDLAFSPLTNLMPVRRTGLAATAGAEDFVMAWISLPELEVTRSAQHYEHVRPGVVRYVDRGEFAGFTADLELDEDGLVVRYPGLAERAS